MVDNSVGFYNQVELAYPISIGDCKLSRQPYQPMVLHMRHSTWAAEKQGADQWQEENKPWVIGRQPFGNIHIANSDADASADTNAAISQAYRAVSEMEI